jgi:riboflavin kinase/FMN adenylyltransferase
MKIFNNINIPTNYKVSSLAIGNFDGVHKGHQKVFRKTLEFTKKNKIKFGVLTFTPLPLMFFSKEIKNYRLVSEDEKLKLLQKYGVNFTVNIKFNKDFSKINAAKFIKKIIYKKLNPQMLSVSNNFKFGNKRKGNIIMLKKFSKKYNYQLLNTSAFKYGGKIVSSTRVRKYLQNGEINLANKLLSRTWFIDGLVEKGKKIGRKLGYHTCNINIKKYILPKAGVYGVKVSIGSIKRIFSGIAYLGSRPTFGGKKIFLEVNIFGVKKNLYKKRLKVYFQKYIRPDKKFKNSQELIKQMNKDVIFVKKGLKTKLVL